MVEPADHLGDDLDDLGMGVSEDRAHLPAREVEHPTAGRVLDERARRPLGDERRERRAVPHEMTGRPFEIGLVRHRAIIAHVAAPAAPIGPDRCRPRLRQNFRGPVLGNS